MYRVKGFYSLKNPFETIASESVDHWITPFGIVLVEASRGANSLKSEIIALQAINLRLRSSYFFQKVLLRKDRSLA
jgi:hypothetical protein